jgi:hypothetical protein
MSDIHIKDFSKTKTQQQIADILGVTQGAVNQAIAASRDIYFKEIEPGVFDCYEIKKPRRKKAA